MTDFRIRVGGLTVAVRSLNDQVVRQCADYRIESHGFARDAHDSDLAIAVTQESIDHEREIGEPGDWSDAYLETLAVHRAIAEAAPTRDRLVFHGATIGFDGRAYIFTAPSGTGKTTHISLWRRAFGDRVSIINGDKPILRFERERERDDPAAPAAARHRVIAYGTPWCGKEGWQRNTSAPLGGICVVARAEAATAQARAAADAATRVNAVAAANAAHVTAFTTDGSAEDTAHTGHDADAAAHAASPAAAPAAAPVTFPDEHGTPNTCVRLDAAEALPLILRQTYMPADPVAAASTLGLLDLLLSRVPVYRLTCTVSEAAVRASAAALAGVRA
ncbi:hypothetical protein [Bifidobacterium parmae]|uniref:Uncharacterized protein n=1 Tax=Bifidobacterium parmae TaxID=361854 RepID=A0A2N5J0H5_9BIFI|nr:hypothetical protein [Bifidobacterium parmae]PLS27720.1 hypothetical protein Uis4E_1406 [Bifidobacterium parmae]